MRLLVADGPVQIQAVVGSSNTADRWTRTVRLWRAGLDLSSWATVMDLLAVESADAPLVLADARIGFRPDAPIEPQQNEAELLGDLMHKTELMIGAVATRFVDDEWRPADVAAIDQIATIQFIGTSSPQLDRLLPYDAVWFEELLTTLHSMTAMNTIVKRAVLFLLARSASHLSFDYVRKLLALVLPAPSAGYEVELAAVVGCHPALLTAMPELRDYLYAADPARSTTVVAVLWRAEAHAAGNYRLDLEVLRLEIDRYVAQSMPFECDHYFTPEFVTYLRAQEPTHWLSHHDVPQIFGDLQGEYLERIAPEDALYVAETWPDRSADFVLKYLLSRGVAVQPLDDLVAVLRDLAGS